MVSPDEYCGCRRMDGLSPSTLPTFMDVPSLLAPLDVGLTRVTLRSSCALLLVDAPPEADDTSVGCEKNEETGERVGGEEAEAGREERGDEEGEGECVE